MSIACPPTADEHRRPQAPTTQTTSTDKAKKGKTAKQWAKDLINEKHLGDCDEARDLIPVMSALDSMVLVDQKEGVINTVAFERLARKALGIVKAYRNCVGVGDWRRPKDAKNWHAKVDYELWKRIDPSKSGADELAFVNRRVEEEVREEVDREASVLKSRAKLAEQKGKDAANLTSF